jgi:hypothetical protein
MPPANTKPLRPSSAGNWIFSNRRWLNPANPYDRARLDASYDALCAAFPAFAACPRAHFLACIAGVASTHHRPLQGIATGLDCPRELAGPWRAYPDQFESTPPVISTTCRIHACHQPHPDHWQPDCGAGPGSDTLPPLVLVFEDPWPGNTSAADKTGRPDHPGGSGDDTTACDGCAVPQSQVVEAIRVQRLLNPCGSTGCQSLG